MLMPSSQLRDLDLVKWLDNKLGDSNELWSGRQAASLLSREMLVELETCFQALESHVKLKIVLAIPHLSYRLMTMWRVPLQNLLALARRDADDWIETVADMYRDYPTRRSVNPVPSNPNSYFCKTLDELRRIIKKHSEEGNLRLLPLDTAVVSQSAIKARYGIGEVEVRKHFNLKRRAKSSTLKADLLKAAEQGVNPAKNQKSGIISSSFPIRIRSTARKPNNDLPMRGIPTVNTCKLSGGFTNEPRKFQRQLAKREGGAKLIDIAEIPHALKKRKREQEAEEKARLKQEREETKKRLLAEKAEKVTFKPGCVLLSPSTSSPVSLTTSTVNSTAKPSSPSSSLASSTAPSTSGRIQQEEVAEKDLPVVQEKPSYADVRERPTMGYTENVSTIAQTISRQLEQRELTSRRQCDELLSSANALDAQGRRMVTAFMAGNKAHPFPQMGDIVTLKLSETYEDEIKPDGTCQRHRVETYFQMDYRTGEWKRLRKTKALRPEEMTSIFGQFAEIPVGLSQAQRSFS
ncbi:unnamed protein product [Enterobius vermicularis]|uniref:HDAg domain-containing protein n=1 Tax=Enterobius vermicularis TaxID=51028 RepID=A0A0N4V2Q0_ENTVE|nr:unnamed protein product [Enterobius vermicularis]